MTTTTMTPVPAAAPGPTDHAPAAHTATPPVPPDRRYRTLQLVLFTVGAVLMPLGIVAICLGWYGTAHAHYAYDQTTYLISGGILGLGLVFLGGFLYFGAWLAKIGLDQRDSARRLADTMLVLADLVSRQSALAPDATQGSLADAGAVPVLAGSGTTVHRRDCQLIAHRDDLRTLTGAEIGLTTCRICRPTGS